MNAVILTVPKSYEITDDRFEEWVSANRDLHLELTAERELVIMPPTGGETGDRNFEISGQLWYWNRQSRLGKAFDSSTGFRLANGAIRSPDVAWIRIDRWQALSPQQRQQFLPLCPDFAIELVSRTDRIERVRDKMREYVDNGLRLGWLIEPESRAIEIYRSDRTVKMLESPFSLSGEDILPGFILDLQPIWAN